MRRSRVPIGATVLSALSGFLIVVHGVLLIEVGTYSDTPALAGLGGVVQSAGYVALFLGALIVVLTSVLVGIPEAHRGIGIMILTFALLSLPVGGGFLIGTLLGWVGGVAAIVARPERIPLGELDRDWVEVLDDPVVEADFRDAGVPLPPIQDPTDRSP